MLAVVTKNPQFAKLWLAQVVSQGGDWLNRIACLTLIGSLGGTGLEASMGMLFGLELAVRLFPSAALGPLAGMLADRWSRRRVMIGADLLRAGIVLLLLFVDEPGELNLLYVLIMLQMGVGIFFDAARSAALPDTVRPDELHSAYTLSSATWSVMLSAGALAGGFLVEWVGVRGVFLVDAASYLASTVFLLGLRLPPSPAPSRPLRWREVLFLTDMRRALAYSREVKISAGLWTKTFWGAAGGYLVALSLAGPVWFAGTAGSADADGAAAFATGALYASRGIGTGVGPILARAYFGSGDHSLRRQIGLGFTTAAVGYAAFGFTRRLDLACLCIAIAHVGGSALWVASTVLWQRRVESAFRGRVFALEFFGMNVSFALGGLLGGWLFDWTGSLAWMVWAVSVLVLGLSWLWSRIPVGTQPESGTWPAATAPVKPD